MAKQKQQLTEAPDDLTTEQKWKLKFWCENNKQFKHLVPHLRELVDACLEYHQSRGNRYKDWQLVCRTWIRNSEEWKRGGQPKQPPTVNVELEQAKTLERRNQVAREQQRKEYELASEEWQKNLAAAREEAKRRGLLK